jgi:hypothetical protein
VSHQNQKPTNRGASQALRGKKKITIKVSVSTAMALEYYRFLQGVEPARVAGSMVEYYCANSFRQGVDPIFEFAFDASHK